MARKRSFSTVVSMELTNRQHMLRKLRSVMAITTAPLLVTLAACTTLPTIVSPRADEEQAPKTIVVPHDAPTIGEALLRAGRGTVINVRAGRYEEHIVFRPGITLRGEGRELTVIAGSHPTHPTLRASGCEDGLIEDIGFEYDGGGPNYVVWFVDSSISMRNCSAAGGTLSGILVSGKRSRPIFRQVLAVDNAESGFVFANGANGLLRGCTAWRNGMVGVSVDGGHPALEFNTIVDNQGAGIWTYGGSRSQVIGNLVVGNKWGITAVASGPHGREGRPVLDSNLAWDNAKGDYVKVRTGRLDISADPLFADRANGDFRPLQGTPALLPEGIVRGAWPLSAGDARQPLAEAPLRGGGRPALIVPDNYDSIQAAIDAAQPGDTVTIKAGRYREALSLVSEVSLRGESRDAVVVENPRQGVPALMANTVTGCAVEGITFRGGHAGRDYVGWVIDSEVEIRDCAFVDGPLAGLEVRGKQSQARIEDCKIQGNKETGLIFLDGARGTVRGNDVSRNGLNGIAVSGGAAPDLFNNTVVDNKGVGIWIRDDAGSLVERNVVVGNKWGISAEAVDAAQRPGRPALAGNVVWANAQGNFVRVTRGPGDLEADPLLVDRAGGDYRPAPGSPAVAADGTLAGAYPPARETARPAPSAASANTLLVPSQYPTITDALRAAAPGAEIVVAPGVYNERVSLVSNVTLRAEVKGKARLQASEGAAAVLQAENAVDAVVEGFDIVYTGLDKAYGVELQHSTVTLRDCVVSGATLTGISVWGGTVSIIGTTVRDNTESGIALKGGANGLVQRCTIVGNGLNGISVDGGAPLIEHNTIVDNQGVGIWVRNRSTARVERNILDGNTWGISAAAEEAAGSKIEAGAPTLDANCVQSLGENFEQVKPSALDMTADPMFVDRNKGDFRLMPNSPAILPDGTPRGAWPVAK